MEDSFIVDLYWRRDEQAIAETERKYGGACEGIARRFLPAAEDAEEIVQDAYLSLWNTIPPQRPEHFAAYLFRTVRNAAFSRFRADSAQKRGGGEADAALDELAECVAGRENVEFSVSATTRRPRPGEREGVDYFFVSRERFEEMLRNDELLEHAEFVGNCYGTPKSQVCARLESGVSVILDIEVQGAAQVKQKMPEAVTVFLAPPGLDALERRLRGRGTESEETIRARLDTARREMALAPSYDYTVINDDPDRASRELGAILDK